MRGQPGLLFAATFLAVSASAQPMDFGVQDYNYTFLSAVDFRPADSTTTYSTVIGVPGFPFAVFRTGGGTYFAHGFVLPPGALLESATLYVRDTNAGSDVFLNLCQTWRTVDTGGTANQSCLTGVHTTGTPGDTAIVAPWNAYVPAVTGSTEYNYFVLVSLGATDSSHMFSGVRLKWKRVVSPPPLTATFTDVPTSHQFFQFVEALAKSGITTGCTVTPPQYCPDAFLTRGQMAVFLSRALGLHWAP